MILLATLCAVNDGNFLGHDEFPDLQFLTAVSEIYCFTTSLRLGDHISC